LLAIIENSKHADLLRNHLNNYTQTIKDKSHLKGVNLLADLL